MEFLTVSAGLHRIHHDILRSHERQLAHEPFLNDPGIDHQAVHHVHVQIQNTVHGQKCLGHADTLVGGIIQGALEPLSSGSDHGI